ncbi:MAG: hypothetical protein CBD37_00565 [Cyanobacteria bacterium TMED177]|nr:MAG: hypothetical protein CBD37_00565 [Cyanobacteria bacterium TMED177]
MQSLLIRLIVIKKAVVATLLLLLSLAAALGSQDMGRLAELADVWGASDRVLLEGLARQGLALGPDALRAVAAIAAVYAVCVYVAAWASWTERHWGDWLLVGLLVVPLPLEVIELIHTKSPSNLVVLGLTLVGLTVVLARALRR